MDKIQKQKLREIARGRDKFRYYAVARHLISSWGRFPRDTSNGDKAHIDIDDFIARHELNEKIEVMKEESIKAIAEGRYRDVHFWFYCHLKDTLDPFWRYSDQGSTLRNGELTEETIKAVREACHYEYDPLHCTSNKQTYALSYLGITDPHFKARVLLHPKFNKTFDEYNDLRNKLNRKVPRWRQGRPHIEPILKNRHLPESIRYLFSPASERKLIYALTDRAATLRDAYQFDDSLQAFPDTLCYDIDHQMHYIDTGVFSLYIG